MVRLGAKCLLGLVGLAQITGALPGRPRELVVLNTPQAPAHHPGHPPGEGNLKLRKDEPKGDQPEDDPHANPPPPPPSAAAAKPQSTTSKAAAGPPPPDPKDDPKDDPKGNPKGSPPPPPPPATTERPPSASSKPGVGPAPSDPKGNPPLPPSPASTIHSSSSTVKPSGPAGAPPPPPPPPPGPSSEKTTSSPSSAPSSHGSTTSHASTSSSLPALTSKSTSTTLHSSSLSVPPIVFPPISISTTTSSAVTAPSPAKAGTCSAGGVTYTTGQRVTDGAGNTYIIHCSTDNTALGTTIVGVGSGGFGACFAECDNSASCVGWTYSGADSGNCYLKTFLGTYFPSSNTIVTAFRDNAPNSPPSISVPLSATSTGNLVPSVSPLPPARGTCAQLGTSNATFSDNIGRVWSLQCGHDYTDHDISAQAVTNYQECFVACDAKAGCTAFSYVGDSVYGTCYLKSAGAGEVVNSNVDSAICISGCDVAASPASSASATGSASNANSTSSPSDSGITACTAIAPGGQGYYTDSTGCTYEMTCRLDYPGNDIEVLPRAIAI
ncbi:hypothetical protein LTR78_006565 [Recurvomyces mirabilis]|uniref:Apple domain-containing protein n=1 Tax=Recurvomyces mirabilis TaxID=574656 RepID=A0AAE0WL22_9PEZI|nr:hypothetical protein LTR78_006565 [Recurvomyces mirabilis]KAK5151017.1 hypothetical protein LTS14_009512 [Recurvomyces mirabilis]